MLLCIKRLIHHVTRLLEYTHQKHTWRKILFSRCTTFSSHAFFYSFVFACSSGFFCAPLGLAQERNDQYHNNAWNSKSVDTLAWEPKLEKEKICCQNWSLGLDSHSWRRGCAEEFFSCRICIFVSTCSTAPRRKSLNNITRDSYVYGKLQQQIPFQE